MAGSSKNVFQPRCGMAAATQLTPKEAVAPRPTSVFMSGRFWSRADIPPTRMSRPGPRCRVARFRGGVQCDGCAADAWQFSGGSVALCAVANPGRAKTCSEEVRPMLP